MSDNFSESAFGDVYKGTFFDEDLPKYRDDVYKTKKSAEVSQFIGVPSKVRLPTETETHQEIDRAINNHYGLGGALGNAVPQPFSGKIFF